jgi:hypothetical protein
MKHKLTKADLKKRLSDLGFKEGDEIELPSAKPNANEESDTNEDDGGGSNPPPGKEKPPKP